MISPELGYINNWVDSRARRKFQFVGNSSDAAEDLEETIISLF